MPLKIRRCGFHYQAVDQTVDSRWDKIASGEEFAELIYDPQRRHLAYGNYKIDGFFNGEGSLSATLSYQRQMETQSSLRVGAEESGRSETHDEIGSLGFSALAQMPMGEGALLSVGMDAYSDSVSSVRNLPEKRAWGRYPDGSSAYDVSLFVQHEIELSDQLAAVVGVNGTFYNVNADLSLEDASFGELDKSGAAFTGSAAASYEAAEGLKAFASVGSGFRAASIDDLTGVQATNQGVQAPSPDVLPERSVERGGWGEGSAAAFLAGRRLFSPHSSTIRWRSVLSLKCTATLRRSCFKISPRSMRGLVITVLDNLDRSAVRGIEADAYFAATPSLTVYGVGTFIRGEVLTLNGAAPDPDKPWAARIRRETPPHATLGARWKPASQPFWAEFFARGAAKQNRLSKGYIRDARIPGLTRDPEEGVVR